MKKLKQKLNNINITQQHPFFLFSYFLFFETSVELNLIAYLLWLAWDRYSYVFTVTEFFVYYLLLVFPPTSGNKEATYLKN